MSFFVQVFNLLPRLLVLGLLVLVPLAPAQAEEDVVAAGGAAVDVFPESSPKTGILPEGFVWNKPLKAGTLVLPRKTDPRRRTTAEPQSPTPPVLPVGELKAPQIADGKADLSSTASVMLLQGMQNAIQQTGQAAPSAKASAVSGAPVSLLDGGAQEKEPLPPSLPAKAPAKSEDGLVYQPGAEPKTLAVLGAADTAAMDAAKKDFAAEDSIFGAPVPESKPSAPKVGPCVPQVTKWARSCAESGYPSHFEGNVLGETRVTCPSGEVRDVWLSNTCAAPVGRSGGATAARVEEEPSVILPQDDTPLDASCGTANGLPAVAAPKADLCVRGTATPVTGNGPWRWSCLGLRGGVTVSCAAPPASPVDTAPDQQKDQAAVSSAQDGLCGTSNGAPSEKAPRTGLCEKGSPSKVGGGGPWTWACSGLNGGRAAACAAPAKIDGVCGPAGREGLETRPAEGLCDAGYASAVTGDGPWSWTCSGLYGGGAATCQAMPKVNAVCGQASLEGQTQAPGRDLCSVGLPSRVTGAGPWSWACEGAKGGASVTCTAPVKTDGKCGGAHGGRYGQAPEQALCESGSPSRVTGLGPWNWTCSGLHGGSTESCTATVGEEPGVADTGTGAVASGVRCGAASRVLPLGPPRERLCENGTAGSVDGDGPWTWQCAGEDGQSVSCSTLGAVDGTCGTAGGAPSPEAPSVGLCATGSSSKASLDKKKRTWEWTCSGFMGGTKSACAAPLSKDAVKKLEEKESMGACGPASGRSLTAKPETDLCAVGKASTVRGTGPWSWTCGGTKGPNAVCEALAIVDGVCGASNGSILPAMPSASLCEAGRATEVKGEGPWLWSCVGEGGGRSVSCSAASQAQARVDGTCGAAANAVMTAAPQANLCDTGMASAVHGEGPWAWTCSGTNGGIASTCTTSKVMPKAPPPPGPRVDGLCGFANGQAASAPPEEGLCVAGVLSAMSGNGPWNWSCLGENGGMTVSCTAPLTPPSPIIGTCGAASGVPTLTMPKSGLCSSGISSAVSGKGPWTWSCSGTNGGGAVSCVAPLAGGSGGQGLPSLVTPSVESPRAAPLGLVTPQLPSGALKPIKSDVVPKMKSSKPVASKKAKVKPASEKKGEDLPQAPLYAPALPDDGAPLVPPDDKDSGIFLDGVNESVLDSEGQSVQSARLSLKEDVSVISFERGSDRLSRDAVTGLEKLAAILKANSAVRISLVAYASVDGKIEPRVARKISLARALAIRDFLSGKGVASSRVDVKPMGANVPSGDMDRVDVVVN